MRTSGWLVTPLLAVSLILLALSCGDHDGTGPEQPNTTPTASFTVTPTSGTTSTVFQFDASGSSDAQDSASALQVRWDWENDETWDTQWSAVKAAAHQYDSAGTMTAVLEVKDTGGLTDTTTGPVAVGVANTAPTAIFTVAPDSGSALTVFQFDASGSCDAEDPDSALQVRWDWESDENWDADWSTTKTASHQYDSIGTMTIKLEVRDTGGLTDDTTRHVSVETSVDTTAPAVVTDLSAGPLTATSLVLTWTAPGDDGKTGTAAQYDIRCATTPGTPWDAMIQMTGEPTPKAAGQPESLTVSGLLSGTTYYFQLKTADEIPNWSDLSTVVSFVIEPHALSVSTDSLDFGEELTELTFVIANLGNGWFNWTSEADVSWIDVFPRYGQNGGRPETLTVWVDRASLPTGSHQGQIFIRASEAGNDTIRVSAMRASGIMVSGLLWEEVDRYQWARYRFVRDSVGVADVEIELDGTGAATNELGHFEIPRVDPGTYALRAKKEGFPDFDTTLTVTGAIDFQRELVPFLVDYFPLAIGNSWTYEYHCDIWSSFEGGEYDDGQMTWEIVACTNELSRLDWVVHGSHAGTKQAIPVSGPWPPPEQYAFERDFHLFEEENRLSLSGAYIVSFDGCLVRRHYPAYSAETLVALQGYGGGMVQLKRAVGIAGFDYVLHSNHTVNRHCVLREWSIVGTP